MLPVGIFIPSAGSTTHQDGEPTTIQVRIYEAEKPNNQSELWDVVKLNGELGNSFAVKILDN